MGSFLPPRNEIVMRVGLLVVLAAAVLAALILYSSVRGSRRRAPKYTHEAADVAAEAVSRSPSCSEADDLLK